MRASRRAFLRLLSGYSTTYLFPVNVSGRPRQEKPSADRVKQTVRSIDGVPIAYWRGGTGPSLVIVHGTTADHNRWAPVLPALEQFFTVYAVDRRGRGESGDGTTYSIEREFADITAVVAAARPPVRVLGHSYGAICALEAALRHRVERLALYEPPLNVGAALYPPAVIEGMQKRLEQGDREGVLITFLQEVVRMPPSEIARFRTLPVWPQRIAAAHTIVRELQAVLDYRFDPARFKSLRTPTLLLVGEKSPPIFQDPIKKLAEVLPDNRIVVLAGQQHIAMDGAPSVFAREVIQFMRG